MYTQDEIISLACNEINIVPIGATVPTYISDQAELKFQEVLEETEAQNDIRFQQEEDIYSIPLNVRDIADIGTLNVVVPADYFKASAVKLKVDLYDDLSAVTNSYESPLDLINNERYFGLDKTGDPESVPLYLNIMTNRNGSFLNFWPTVDTVQEYQIVYFQMLYQSQIVLPPTGSDSPEFYNSLKAFLYLSLAAKLCNAFGIPDAKKRSLEFDALQKLRIITSNNNQELEDTQFQPFTGNRTDKEYYRASAREWGD